VENNAALLPIVYLNFDCETKREEGRTALGATSGFFSPSLSLSCESGTIIISVSVRRRVAISALWQAD